MNTKHDNKRGSGGISARLRGGLLAGFMLVPSATGCDAPAQEQAEVKSSPPVVAMEGDERVTRFTTTVKLPNREPNQIDHTIRERLTKGQEELKVQIDNRTQLERVDTQFSEEASTVSVSAGGHTVTAQAAEVGVDDRISFGDPGQTYDAAEAADYVRTQPIMGFISPETWVAMQHGLEVEDVAEEAPTPQPMPTAKWGKIKSAFKWVWHNVIGNIVAHIKV